MEPLRQIREILKAWRKKVEVLPAAGGALEDLLHPDAEEREERAFTDERIFDTIWERAEKGGKVSLYRPTPPITRTETHLFRYFLDGSMRSYFLGTALEGDRNTPVHYAQIGACVLFRRDDGTVQREHLEVRHLLLASRKDLSEEAWLSLESLCQSTLAVLEDLAAHDVISQAYSDVDLRFRAGGKVRYKMRELEAELMQKILSKLSNTCWLVADGSLMFQPILQLLKEYGETILPILGVSKNFRKDPQFVFGRGPSAKRFSIYSLLADLKHEHRTAAFSAYSGQVIFWYVRLRPQGQVDYPLMGVVKCELVTPKQEPVPSELVDFLSSALVAERNVTPHGRDRRWHAHLYPIHLTEQAIRNAFYSRDVVQQLMRWR
ncbi:MAG: hypothetical protein J7K20_02765 [Thermodesulfobacterium sp.]|nr:hypothetical protein [Thermodesulfobacterium sp.]